MDITDRLYVEIHPMETGQIPHPHPVTDGHFDPDFIYKVLGMYNPSETSECYFVLTNPQRQIWFIPQRHVLAFALLDSDELFLSRDKAEELRRSPAGRNKRTMSAIPAVESPPRSNGADHPGDRTVARPGPQMQTDPSRWRSGELVIDRSKERK
jgi:hypothetical protein